MSSSGVNLGGKCGRFLVRGTGIAYSTAALTEELASRLIKLRIAARLWEKNELT